ncbi:MAG: UDP-N-acetylmuramate dehydrogenase [Candidatus Gastranaerophilales bacterium]|nr:UDP-N-acetylmuramate dehydrogenase [Candidatus Gastranaerophilales bacterium]
MVEIFENYEIKNESTFKIGGIVKKVAFPSSIDELVQLLQTNQYDIVLGNCSNVLFSSDFIDKSIIITKNINEYTFKENKLYVTCGVKGPVLSREAQKLGLSGLEFMIGFPGSIGGMISMNASAHNQAIQDVLVSARVFDLKENIIKEFTKEQMKFEYRKSILSKGENVLLDAVFELKRDDIDKIQELMNRNIEFRKLRQPSLKYGNAGSTFKNPENDSAGRLLDLCEMKGQKQGGAMVFENHANFVLNYCNATSLDVITLMYTMYSKVREKYRIELRPEIKYIGDRGTEEYKLWQIMTENTH